MTTSMFFAPPSSMERFAPRAQPSAIFFAVGVEPTRQTPAMRGSSYHVSASSRCPWMTLTTPAGRPISMKISHIFCMKYGDWVDGLKMNVLPVTMA